MASDQEDPAQAGRLLGIPSRQAGPGVSLRVSRRLFSAPPDLFLPCDPEVSPAGAWSVISPFPGLPGYRWSRVLWVTLARTVVSERIERLASRHRFHGLSAVRAAVVHLRKQLWVPTPVSGDGITADLDPSLWMRPVDRWTMMVAGPPSTIHQNAHGQPNAKFDQRAGAGIACDASCRFR